ncbi:MAG: ribonuclease HII, partial [Nevskiaceae bacterium]|nr:ribonuclease HII [Nevskiaceae bacterium]
MDDVLIAGVDEAGRGPLVGPVFAAAVILNPAAPIEGLRDSKQLTARARERLAAMIRERSLCWAVAWADAEEIDALNILGATLLAMRRAVCQLSHAPERVLVDGNRLPYLADRVARCEAVVGGDAKVPAISAASILAKCARDALMPSLDAAYPGYQLCQHKGYPTAAHCEALRR